MKIAKVDQNLVENKGKEGKAMRVGDMVKIKKCDSMPEVVGGTAEIVDLQMQEIEQYRTYPVWVKMTSGKRKGKIYGFRHGEVGAIPKVKVYEAKTAGTKMLGGLKTMNTKVGKQMEEILTSITSLEEIAEVENTLNKVKGKIPLEPTLGFWEGKTPCWEMFRCPDAMKKECPAFKYRTLPCWQIEGTYCKLMDYGDRGDGTVICENCRVYKRWGHGEPIEIKLCGKGFNTVGVEAKQP